MTPELPLIVDGWDLLLMAALIFDAAAVILFVGCAAFELTQRSVTR